MKVVAAILLLLLAALASLWTSSEGSVLVILNNVGDEPLRGVVVHVTGRSYPVGDVLPAGVAQVSVQARGDSNIEIEHGNAQREIVDCYLQPGYSGSISVALSVAGIADISNAIQAGYF